MTIKQSAELLSCLQWRWRACREVTDLSLSCWLFSGLWAPAPDSCHVTRYSIRLSVCLSVSWCLGVFTHCLLQCISSRYSTTPGLVFVTQALLFTACVITRLVALFLSSPWSQLAGGVVHAWYITNPRLCEIVRAEMFQISNFFRLSHR